MARTQAQGDGQSQALCPSLPEDAQRSVPMESSASTVVLATKKPRRKRRSRSKGPRVPQMSLHSSGQARVRLSGKVDKDVTRWQFLHCETYFRRTYKGTTDELVKVIRAGLKGGDVIVEFGGTRIANIYDYTYALDAVKIGQTPSGKTMRFEHDGSYADIDATYDAITAYLDEKGVDAQDSFIEEYANDVKEADDPALQVNIYVLLK